MSRIMKTLLIGISVRAMAESAVRGGYRVVALDAFGDRDLRALTESRSLRRDFGFPYSPENLYRAGLNLEFDSFAYTSNLENHPEIVSRFAEKSRIIGNSPKSVARVRHWPELFSALRDAGFHVPKTFFRGNIFTSGPGDRWLEKPLSGGGGHGIRYVHPSPGYISGNDDASVRADGMIQEYVTGIPCSASFVANGMESVVIGVSEQLIGLRFWGASGFRYCGNIVPAPAMFDPNAGGSLLGEIRAITNFLSREFSLYGANGIDFILRNGEIYVTEVNPRYAASMEIVETAYGLPVFDLHLRSVLNSELPVFDLESELRPGRFSGKAYLYAERDVTIPDTGNWTARGIRDIPECGEKIDRGGPVCTILADGTTRDEVLRELKRRAEEIKAEIYA
jgi:predicted ATP-grasp superfamily ATP-dependent carboligase